MIARLSHGITAALAPLTVGGAVLAYLYPPLFQPIGSVFLWLFGLTMFALGLVLQPAELGATLRRPARIGAGVATQYSVMPLLGFAAAWLLPLSPEVALGFILVASAPGAMASNVLVYLAGGVVAYSIALTTVATLLAPLVTPTLVHWLGGVFVPVEFWPMVRTILFTVLLPLAGGMTLARLAGPRVAPLRALAPALAALAIILICAYAVSINHGRIADAGPWILLAVVLVNGLGYLAGWQLARWYGFDARHRLTLSIEIGMQNAGLGVALALAHFPPEAALPGALFAVWSVITATGASAWLRRRGRGGGVAGPLAAG
ncbi:bile acid:sodium symporter family protein [Ectothiorhodospiraceae bacterium 2226]|nr:bile acid:sodium symporter family protein [Ectothiorhodospiraceae bacterium 2226]